MNKIFDFFSKFGIVFLLGFLSGLPLALFSTTLQAWFSKANHTVIIISSLSLLQLPFLVRFLWGPLLDKIYIKSLGRRKTWLLISQFLLFITIEWIGLYHPASNVWKVLVIALFMAIISSIQDVVIDAHRIEYVDPAYYGFAAVTAVYAYRLALLLSGGLSLILAEKIGFQLTYQLLGCFFLLGILVVYFSHEPVIKNLDNSKPVHGAYMELLQQPWCGVLIGLIISLKMGEVFVANTSPMMVPFMVNGLGLSLSKIAYVNKIFGLFAQLLGGVLSASLMMRFSLMNLLLYLGGLQVMSNLGFWMLSEHPMQEHLLWLVVLGENLSSGMTSTVLVAFLMKIVNKQYTASQFSFWMVFVILPRFLAGPIGGYWVQHFSWTQLFQMSSLVTLMYLIFWLRLKKLMRNSSGFQLLEPVFKSPT